MVLETPIVAGSATEAFSVLCHVLYMPVYRVCQHNSLTTVQDAVMKLYRFVVVVQAKGGGLAGVGSREGAIGPPTSRPWPELILIADHCIPASAISPTLRQLVKLETILKWDHTNCDAKLVCGELSVSPSWQSQGANYSFKSSQLLHYCYLFLILIKQIQLTSCNSLWL